MFTKYIMLMLRIDVTYIKHIKHKLCIHILYIIYNSMHLHIRVRGGYD